MSRRNLIFVTLVALALLHFHSGDAFTRALIRFDDHTFIEPLKNLSLQTYFTEWLGKPNHYAFPLRDATFALDFWLSDALGFQTFWFTNFVLYALFLGVWAKVFQALAPHPEPHPRSFTLGSLWLLGACHPLTVEMVQWASNRKHLLVGLFTALGTWLTVQRWNEHRKPSESDLFLLLLGMMASWLCWPSGMLWIFWCLGSFWLFRLRAPRLSWAMLWATTFTFIALRLTQESNSDFSKPPTDGLLAVRFGAEGIGRGFLTLILPFWRAPYYRLGAWQNALGLGLLLTFFSFLLVFARRAIQARKDPQRKERARRSLILLALSAAFLLPTGNIFLTYTEFVWADRYLFLLWFPLLAAIAQLIPPGWFKGRMQYGGFALAAGLYTLSWLSVPSWHSAADLFDRCSVEENSAKCVHLAIEARFDENECQQAPYHFLRARELSRQYELKEDFTFRTEVPLYESLCAAEAPLPFEELQRMLADIRSVYRTPYYAVVGEILILLQAGQREQALQKALDSFLDPQKPIPESSGKLLSLLTGVTEGLCVVSQIQDEPAKKETLDPKTPLARLCEERRAALAHRIQGEVVKEKQRAWGFNRTIGAYNRSRKISPHATTHSESRSPVRLHLESPVSPPPRVRAASPPHGRAPLES